MTNKEAFAFAPLAEYLGLGAFRFLVLADRNIKSKPREPNHRVPRLRRTERR